MTNVIITNTEIITEQAQQIQVITEGIQGPQGPQGLGTDLKNYQLTWITPTNASIVLLSYATYMLTLNNIFALQTSSGSIILTININGVPVTGFSNITVNSTPQNITASANNVVAVSDAITMVLTSNSSASGLQFTMQGTL